MELNLQRRMTGLKEKIPDIQKTLDTVQFLKLRKVRPEDPLETSDAERRLGGNRPDRNHLRTQRYTLCQGEYPPDGGGLHLARGMCLEA